MLVGGIHSHLLEAGKQRHILMDVFMLVSGIHSHLLIGGVQSPRLLGSIHSHLLEGDILVIC